MRTQSQSDASDVPTAPARSGIHAYDHLIPELRRHAAARPTDAGRDARRAHLITEFQPLVRNLARRFSTPQTSEDIEQVGMVGLVKAIDRYDPDATDHGPLAYLVPSVRGEIKRHLRDTSWALRVPRRLRDLAVDVNRVSSELGQKLGHAPRPSEVAAELGVPVEDVLETFAALESYATASLDEPVPGSDQPLAEVVAGEHDDLDVVEQRGELRRLLAELPERERTIVLLRFFGEQTQTQIAEQVGISQMHVSRLLTRTLHRLRQRLTGEDTPTP